MSNYTTHSRRGQTSPKINVAAKVVAKKFAVAALKAELLKLIVPTRKETGCIEYFLHQDNHDPAVFFYETWEDADSLEKHINTDHYKAYVKAVGDMIEEKVVNKMTRIEQGLGYRRNISNPSSSPPTVLGEARYTEVMPS